MTTTLTAPFPPRPRMPLVRQPRTVERLVAGQATSDGDGVKLTRVLTQPLQRRLDPFLMLDAFGSDDAGDYIGGFPDHPHRGFETVTYMIAGRMRHRDSAGNEGLLQNGGVQWMTAGRGLIHSELPEQEEGRMEGFQLWLNLPAADKMGTPGYRDIPSGEIPELRLAGVTARVIAGASHGVAGAVQKAHTEPLYLDLHLEAGATLRAGAAGRPQRVRLRVSRRAGHRRRRRAHARPARAHGRARERGRPRRRARAGRRGRRPGADRSPAGR